MLFLCVTKVSVIYLLSLIITPFTKSPVVIPVAQNIESPLTISYVGYTNDINRRIKKHNENKGAKSTRGFKWKLIFHRKFLSKSCKHKST